MATFGETLRSEREQRGLSLDDVARSVALGAERLAALERGELSAMPDDDAMSAHLREYAAVLGVDAELMFEDYRREREACLQRLDAAIEAPASATTAATAVPAAPDVPVAPDVPLAADAATALPPVVPWKTYRAFAAVALGLVATVWALSGPGDPASAPSAPPIAEPAPQAEAKPAPESALPAAPDPAPQIAPKTAAAPAGAIAVEAAGVGSAVRDRQLVGEASTFAVGEQVWFWNRVVDGAAGDRIEHVWLHEGVEKARIALRIGGSRWRTQSAKSMHPGSAGAWTVEARDASGRVLARAAFDCVP